MVLLTTVTLCCGVVAGALAVLEPVSGQAPEKQVADGRPIESASPTPVRVVGAPFVPRGIACGFEGGIARASDMDSEEDSRFGVGVLCARFAVSSV
ncbi:hypothetical protein, partial [Bradyrhizobium guangzhouense]|uniref:hypothetical protein n=1 Tax=Bradyrhizobium guangzhouense TaxID=1325095 RepID=UPI001FDF1388